MVMGAYMSHAAPEHKVRHISFFCYFQLVDLYICSNHTFAHEYFLGV
jgi:hypothetical protein